MDKTPSHVEELYDFEMIGISLIYNWFPFSGVNNHFCNQYKKYLKKKRGGVTAQQVGNMVVGWFVFRPKAPMWILTSPVNGPE